MGGLGSGGEGVVFKEGLIQDRIHSILQRFSIYIQPWMLTKLYINQNAKIAHVDTTSLKYKEKHESN